MFLNSLKLSKSQFEKEDNIRDEVFKSFKLCSQSLNDSKSEVNKIKK